MDPEESLPLEDILKWVERLRSTEKGPEAFGKLKPASQIPGLGGARVLKLPTGEADPGLEDEERWIRALESLPSEDPLVIPEEDLPGAEFVGKVVDSLDSLARQEGFSSAVREGARGLLDEILRGLCRSPRGLATLGLLGPRVKASQGSQALRTVLEDAGRPPAERAEAAWALGRWGQDDTDVTLWLLARVQAAWATEQDEVLAALLSALLHTLGPGTSQKGEVSSAIERVHAYLLEEASHAVKRSPGLRFGLTETLVTLELRALKTDQALRHFLSAGHAAATVAAVTALHVLVPGGTQTLSWKPGEPVPETLEPWVKCLAGAGAAYDDARLRGYLAATEQLRSWREAAEEAFERLWERPLTIPSGVG